MNVSRRLRKPLVIGTVVVVQAAVGLSLIHFATNSTYHFIECDRELNGVQAGLDAYMANNNTDTVARATNTSDMTNPVVPNNHTDTATNPSYVRNGQSQWSYVRDSTGRITAIAPGPSGAIPPGCIVVGG